MSQTNFETPASSSSPKSLSGKGAHHQNFARAAFLPELRCAQREALASSVTMERTALDDAAEIVREWQEAIRLDDARFDERLAVEGLDRASFCRLLATRKSAGTIADSWTWPNAIHAALDRMAKTTAAVPRTTESSETAADSVPFARALQTFVAAAWESLRACAPVPSGRGLEVDWDALAGPLNEDLSDRLALLCKRTLVLELNVARLRHRLQGETPRARYRYYVENLLCRPQEWEALFEEYPVLARLLGTTMQLWVDVVSELVGHLAADFPKLRELFGHGDRPWRLVGLASGISDLHRGGRGVWKLRFAEGHGANTEPLQLVYKPRSLAVDTHFQALLAFCNQGGREGALHLDGLRHTTFEPAARSSARSSGSPIIPGFPSFSLLRVLDCGGHGWVEHVARQDCDDSAGAERFYVRQGAYLALLHLVDGADIHHENVIACGEHPVIVDVEALFHHRSGPRRGDDANTRALEWLGASVLRVGLLPGRVWGDAEHAGVNIGGLGNGESQMTPGLIATWDDVGADTMHASEEHRELRPGDNLPRLAGAIVPVAQHAEALVAGFEAMVRFLCTRADALRAADGPLAAFGEDPVRQLLRDTATYSKALHVGRHPDRLRDMLQREQLLDVFWGPSFDHQPALLRVVPHEKDDLRLGDVPYFTTRPSSCHLWDSRGVVMRDFFSTTAMASVMARLDALDERELEAQVFVIRASLSAAHVRAPESPRATECARAADESSRNAAKSPAPLAARAIETAWEMGDRLVRTAIFGEYDTTWLGMMDTTGADSAFQLAPLDPYLYGGTSGVALFLAYLGHVTREPRFTQLAQRAAIATRAALLERQAIQRPSGGFVGIASQLYALSHLAALWHDPALLPPLAPLLEQVVTCLTRDHRFDVALGAAGCILALLALRETTGDEDTLAAAVACGRHLVHHAVRTEQGAAWTNPMSTRMLLGFSHGTAGIACALSSLAHTLVPHEPISKASISDATIAEAATFNDLSRDARRFERRSFDASAGNWPDLRDPSEPRFPIAWCHGAPGIALARLASPDLASDLLARREIEIAIATTLAAPVRADQSLCHGELGNLMIVQYAAASMGRLDWHHHIEERLETTLARIARSGPRCDFDAPTAAPALMNGIAGIGYGLLRLAQPDDIPMVLALQPIVSHPASLNRIF